MDSADMVEMLVEALKRIPEESCTKGIAAARGLLVDADFNSALRRLVASELKESDHSWHVLAREQFGGSDYRQMIDDLEAENPGKVAESVESYGVSKEKMTQRGLFD